MKEAKGWRNVKEFGAKGDGRTDDTHAIQRAILEVAQQEGGLLFPGGQYRIDGELDLASNLTLKGEGEACLDFSQRADFCTQRYLMCGVGQAQKVGVLESSLKGTDAFTLQPMDQQEAPVLQEGDLVGLASTVMCRGEGVNRPVGELAHVAGVTQESEGTPPVYRLTHDFHHPYAKGSVIYAITPIENVTLDGLTLKGKGQNPHYGSKGQMRIGDYGLGFIYGQHILVQNCTFIDLDRQHLEFKSCYHFTAQNNRHETQSLLYYDKELGKVNSFSEREGDDFNPQKNQTAALQYQIRVADACYDGLIQECHGEGGRHMVNMGYSTSWIADGGSEQEIFGVSHHITIQDCVSNDATLASFATHDQCQHILFERCRVDSSWTAGFDIRAENVEVSQCEVHASRIGVWLRGDFVDTLIHDNHFQDISFAGILFEGDAPEVTLNHGHVIIQQNVMEEMTQGIFLHNTNRNRTIGEGKDDFVGGTGVFTIKENTLREIHIQEKDFSLPWGRGAICLSFLGFKYAFDILDNTIYGLSVEGEDKENTEVGAMYTAGIFVMQCHDIFIQHNRLRDVFQAMAFIQVKRVRMIGNMIEQFPNKNHLVVYRDANAKEPAYFYLKDNRIQVSEDHDIEDFTKLDMMAM